ncbi:hypothetical protein ABZ853_20590 [Streptomyces albidoflavus]
MSGAAPVLLLCAAATPVAHRFGERFGSVPWWVVVWPVAATVVLLAGAGARRSLNRAAWLALPGLPLGLLAYLNGAEELPPPGPFLPAPEQARPAAALLAAVLCLVAAVLCRVLGRARELSAEPSRSARLLSHATVWGAVAGIALTSVTGYAALEVEESRRGEPSLVDATARTVPEGERGEGVRMTHAAYEEQTPYGRPSEVLWDKKLPSTTALTTCLLDANPPFEGDEPTTGYGTPVIARSTLVAVEAGKGWDAVVGYDPADGAERWRYTIRYEDDGRSRSVYAPGWIGQVGVSGLCRVYVVADDSTLVTLHGNSGVVLNEAGLPGGGSARGWKFLTSQYREPSPGEDYERTWQRVVPLGNTRQVFLNGGRGLMEVEQRTGRLISATRSTQCSYLTAPAETPGYVRPHEPVNSSLLGQYCDTPQYTEVGLPPARTEWGRADSEQYDVFHRSPVQKYEFIPSLGCDREPLVTDFRGRRDRLAVAGVWCRGIGKAKGEDERKLLVSSAGSGVQVAELPEDTPLPLNPVIVDSHAPTDHHTLWLADGELHGLQSVGGGEVLHSAPGATYRSARFRTLYSGPEPLEAVKVFSWPGLKGDAAIPLLAYAVTRSGTVLVLEHERVGENGPAAHLDLTVLAELPQAAARCAGTRDITVDHAGLKLLTWCTTEQGSKVTAVGLEAIPQSGGR